MAAAPSIREFFRRERIPHTFLSHRQAFSAQQEAAASHVPGGEWAKTVVCFADDEPIQAVLPAPMFVDFDALRNLSRATAVRLASEKELERLYPDCELGAVPPLGSLYRQRVFVDRGLGTAWDVVFCAGTHTDAVCMAYDDYVAIVRPVIGSFCRSLPPAASNLPLRSAP